MKKSFFADSANIQIRLTFKFTSLKYVIFKSIITFFIIFLMLPLFQAKKPEWLFFSCVVSSKEMFNKTDEFVN